MSCPMTGKKTSSPCTQECIKGTIHAGLPIGKEETIHGLNTYIVGNRETPRAIIVVYTDIFGLPLPNNKLIADAYARSNSDYLVYMPDFFEGDPVPLKVADVLLPVDASKQSTLAKYGGMLASAPSFIMWMGRHKAAHCEQVCTEWLKKLRNAEGSDKKVGMVGFCWGGRYAILAGQEKSMVEKEGKRVPLVDAVVAMHPSNLVLPDDVQEPIVPITYGWGVKDEGVSYKQKGIVEETHATAAKKGRTMPEQVHESYDPGRHGWSVRGNPDDPIEREAMARAQKQGEEWFAKYL